MTGAAGRVMGEMYADCLKFQEKARKVVIKDVCEEAQGGEAQEEGESQEGGEAHGGEPQEAHEGSKKVVVAWQKHINQGGQGSIELVKICAGQQGEGGEYDIEAALKVDLQGRPDSADFKYEPFLHSILGDHPNLIKLIQHGTVESISRSGGKGIGKVGENGWALTDSKVKGKPYMVMELAEAGELYDFMEELGAEIRNEALRNEQSQLKKQPELKTIQGPTLRERFARYVCHQMVRALSHMHHKGWAHLDVKIENIFVANDLVLKLGDYGFAEPLPGFPSKKIHSHFKGGRLWNFHFELRSISWA
jgi:serine/threonine protein kinase